jgi:hypothetical protein
MKVISFSLWGSIPMHNLGAVRNAQIAKELFPDWKCIFYCFSSVPDSIIEMLSNMDNVEIRKVEGVGDNTGMFNRFLPISEENVEYCIIRDADSRLSPREKIAIDEWIQSNKDFHIMRDHPYHGTPILGGMWGIKGGIIKNISEAIKQFNASSDKGQDQFFLTKYVFPLIQQGKISCLIHDPFFDKKPFPANCKRGDENNGVWFIGQVFDENDKFNSQSDIDILVAYEH